MGREPLFKPVDQEILCHLQLLVVADQSFSRKKGGTITPGTIKSYASGVQ